MTNYTIDNSDGGDLLRTITWQYDGAPHLVAIIRMFKDFYDAAVKDFFDSEVSRLDLVDNPDIDDHGLSIWGKILGVPRHEITYGDPEQTTTISRELYRRILIGRFKILSGNASIPSYISYLDFVLGEGNYTVTDGGTMSLVFEYTGDDEETEALFEQHPEIVCLYPAGVKSNEHSSSYMFGFDGQQKIDDNDPDIGGLDEASFNWRLKRNGEWRQ